MNEPIRDAAEVSEDEGNAQGVPSLAERLRDMPAANLRVVGLALLTGSFVFPAVGLFLAGGLDSWTDVFPGMMAFWFYGPSLLALVLAMGTRTRAGWLRAITMGMAAEATIVLLLVETVASTHDRPTELLHLAAPLPAFALQVVAWVVVGRWAGRHLPDGFRTF